MNGVLVEFFILPSFWMAICSIAGMDKEKNLVMHSQEFLASFPKVCFLFNKHIFYASDIKILSQNQSFLWTGSMQQFLLKLFCSRLEYIYFCLFYKVNFFLPLPLWANLQPNPITCHTVAHTCQHVMGGKGWSESLQEGKIFSLTSTKAPLMEYGSL